MAATQTVTYSTTPPANPNDGDQWILPADPTNGILWRFRYNTSSPSAYKWEFSGGADAFAQVGTAEGTSTVGAWVDLATIGPRVVLPRAGDYLAESLGTAVSHTAAGATVYTAAWLNTTGQGAAMNTTLPIANVGFPLPGITHRFIGTSANDEIRQRYYNGSAGTATFGPRWLLVRPIRVS